MATPPPPGPLLPPGPLPAAAPPPPSGPHPDPNGYPLPDDERVRIRDIIIQTLTGTLHRLMEENRRLREAAPAPPDNKYINLNRIE